jgi:hypothetical protein
MPRNDNPLPGVQEQWVSVLIRIVVAALSALIAGS